MAVAQSVILDRAAPANSEQLAELLREAHAARRPVYPVGGGTSAAYGLTPTQPGIELATTELNRVIDYPAADMTITVEAGITMEALTDVLAASHQRLPLDVPQAAQATLGGVLATNFSGPLRFGHGTARDYVIGIRACDGRGESFAGGGRVVKNVAGYDFCKMLIGSFGTLGVIHEVTLKLKPQAFGQTMLVATPRSLEECERIFALLMTSTSQPSAIEWVKGREWAEQAKACQWPAGSTECGWIVLLLEGSESERGWMVDNLQQMWKQQIGPQAAPAVLADGDTHRSLAALRESPAAAGAAAVLKLQTVPSAVTRMAALLDAANLDLSIQAHAGNGTLLVRVPKAPAAGWSRVVLHDWQPAALAAGGSLVFLAAPGPGELTGRVQWGEPSGPLALLQRIKQQFDPHNILNPQRFVFPN